LHYQAPWEPDLPALGGPNNMESGSLKLVTSKTQAIENINGGLRDGWTKSLLILVACAWFTRASATLMQKAVVSQFRIAAKGFLCDHR